MRITVEKAEVFKEIGTWLCNHVPGGVAYAISDKERITWKVASNGF